MEVKKISNLEIHSDGKIFHNGIKLNHFMRNDRGRKQLRVCIRIAPKKWKTLSPARLVAMAFVENPHDYPHVLHINRNPNDCRAENLKWGFIQWKEFRCKVQPEQIEENLFEMNIDRLSPFGLDLYLFLLGDEQYLVERMGKYGNRVYMYAVVKNEFAGALQFNESIVVNLIVSDFMDNFYSLIKRGYFLPKEDFTDKMYWCYIRNHLKKSVLRFWSRKVYRQRLLLGFSGG